MDRFILTDVQWARTEPHCLTAAARDAEAFKQAGRKDGSNRTEGSLNEEKEDQKGSAA